MWQLVKEKLPEIHLSNTNYLKGKITHISKHKKNFINICNYNSITSIYNSKETFVSKCRLETLSLRKRDIKKRYTTNIKFQEILDKESDEFLLSFNSLTSDNKIVHSSIYLFDGVLVFLETENPGKWEQCGISIDSGAFEEYDIFSYYNNIRFSFDGRSSISYYPVDSFNEAKDLANRVSVASDSIIERGGKIIKIDKNYKIHYVNSNEF